MPQSEPKAVKASLPARARLHGPQPALMMTAASQRCNSLAVARLALLALAFALLSVPANAVSCASPLVVISQADPNVYPAVMGCQSLNQLVFRDILHSTPLVFGQLDRVNNLTVSSFHDLFDFENMFPKLRLVGELVVENNQQLRSLHGLQSLRLLRKLQLVNNPLLADLSAISTLTTINDSLVIREVHCRCCFSLLLILTVRPGLRFRRALRWPVWPRSLQWMSAACASWN